MTMTLPRHDQQHDPEPADLEYLPFDHCAAFTSTDDSGAAYIAKVSETGTVEFIRERRKADRREMDRFMDKERTLAHLRDIRDERTRANLYLVFGYIAGLATSLILLGITS